MPALLGRCIWVSLIDWMCNCVIPGERGTPIHKPDWLWMGWHASQGALAGAKRRPRLLSPAPRLQNWVKNGESSTGSAFSDKSSCDCACPGCGSSPTNSQKPSAIQIACSWQLVQPDACEIGDTSPSRRLISLFPRHKSREEQDVFPTLPFPIPAARDVRRR